MLTNSACKICTKSLHEIICEPQTKMLVGEKVTKNKEFCNGFRITIIWEVDRSRALGFEHRCSLESCET